MCFHHSLLSSTVEGHADLWRWWWHQQKVWPGLQWGWGRMGCGRPPVYLLRCTCCCWSERAAVAPRCCCLWRSHIKYDGMRPLRSYWRNSENSEDLAENCLLGNLTGGCGRAGNACLSALQQLTLQKRTFSIPQGYWETFIMVPGWVMPESLNCLKTSLWPLSRHLFYECLHTNMQACVCTRCVCVWYVCKYIWYVCGICHICIICHVYGCF